MSEPERPSGPPGPPISDRVWTVPNALSALRILLVPVFLVLVLLELDLWALIVIVISSVSDFLDGIIARRFGQITRLGQLLDPAADRLFIFAAVIALAVREVVPWWIVAVIVGRDVLLAGLGLVLARHGYGPLPVHHLGKVATFALFYALPLLVLGQAFPALQPVSDPLGWAFTIWGAFLYWWAGILYVRQTHEVTSRSRAEGADASDTLGVQRRSMDD